jgi:hypothetical protein
MLEWLLDGRRLIAVAIILATLVGAWMFRYESFGALHRNRSTGVVCLLQHECWVTSIFDPLPATKPADDWRPVGSGVPSASSDESDKVSTAAPSTSSDPRPDPWAAFYPQPK